MNITDVNFVIEAHYLHSVDNFTHMQNIRYLGKHLRIKFFNNLFLNKTTKSKVQKYRYTKLMKKKNPPTIKHHWKAVKMYVVFLKLIMIK